MESKTNETFDKSKKITLLLYVIGFVVLFTILLISFTKAFRKKSISESFSLNENSVINYNVKLKANNFYESERLPENMEYIASLIDEIDLTYNYLFSSTNVIDFDIIYSIDAIIRVYNDEENKILFEKSENLVEPTSVNIKDIKDYSLKKDVTINYDDFNAIARSFKSTYALTTYSDLEVVLSIKSNGGDVDIDSKSIIKMPLTEKTINITIDSNNINESSLVKDNKVVNSVSKVYLVFFCITFILSLIVLIKIIKYMMYISKLKTPYEHLLNKILKENDSIIANVKNIVNDDKYEFIFIDTFEELRDIHDNIGNPILFYEVEEGNLSYFLIVDKDIVYKYVLDGKKINGGNQ